MWIGYFCFRLSPKLAICFVFYRFFGHFFPHFFTFFYYFQPVHVPILTWVNLCLLYECWCIFAAGVVRFLCRRMRFYVTVENEVLRKWIRCGWYKRSERAIFSDWTRLELWGTHCLFLCEILPSSSISWSAQHKPVKPCPCMSYTPVRNTCIHTVSVNHLHIYTPVIVIPVTCISPKLPDIYTWQLEHLHTPVTCAKVHTDGQVRCSRWS